MFGGLVFQNVQLSCKIMKLRFFLLAAAAAVFYGTGSAIAHSGGTNAQGCHAGSQPYHCHNRRTSSPARRQPAPQSSPTYRSRPSSSSRPSAPVVPAWSTGNYSLSDSACIKQGPTNLRTSPRMGNDVVRATVPTGSCGQVLTRENGFTLVEFYIVELRADRRYWVHNSQI